MAVIKKYFLYSKKNLKTHVFKDMKMICMQLVVAYILKVSFMQNVVCCKNIIELCSCASIK